MDLFSVTRQVLPRISVLCEHHTAVEPHSSPPATPAISLCSQTADNSQLQNDAFVGRAQSKINPPIPSIWIIAHCQAVSHLIHHAHSIPIVLPQQVATRAWPRFRFVESWFGLNLSRSGIQHLASSRSEFGAGGEAHVRSAGLSDGCPHVGALFVLEIRDLAH